MKIRIVSDLHIDVNSQGDFGFRHEEQDLLLIAGDIAGSYDREIKWLQGLCKDINNPIVAVAGNHLGYDYKCPVNYFLRSYDLDKEVGTKQWSIDKIKQECKDVFYLDNDYIDVGDYIIFGGTMYTDYKLYTDADISKRVGQTYLNDFRYVHVMDGKAVRPIHPDDYQKYHARFMRRLRKCLKETTKDIIVLTHFAPSPQSISEKYQKGNIYLNASYCSNMEKFIKQNPRIKLFVHGHMHDSFDYMIDNCRVICEPYGYKHENKVGHRRYKGKLIEV